MSCFLKNSAIFNLFPLNLPKISSPYNHTSCYSQKKNIKFIIKVLDLC